MPITPAHAAAIARLHAQLDERNVSAGGGGRGALDGQYELLGPHERFVGGAALLPMHMCADTVIRMCMLWLQAPPLHLRTFVRMRSTHC